MLKIKTNFAQTLGCPEVNIRALNKGLV